MNEFSLNTYGLHAVNTHSFQNREVGTSRPIRNAVVTALRINNLTLNILGYMPGFSTISGSIRMLVGMAIGAVTLAIGTPKQDQAGAIIGHFYNEALSTAAAQIFRGACEAFIPFGKFINAAADITATIVNACSSASVGCGSVGGGRNTINEEPIYPAPFVWLYLA